MLLNRDGNQDLLRQTPLVAFATTRNKGEVCRMARSLWPVIEATSAHRALLRGLHDSLAHSLVPFEKCMPLCQPLEVCLGRLFQGPRGNSISFLSTARIHRNNSYTRSDSFKKVNIWPLNISRRSVTHYTASCPKMTCHKYSITLPLDLSSNSVSSTHILYFM